MKGGWSLRSEFFRPTPKESVFQMSSMMVDAGAQLGCGEVQAHGLVAAGDVEADGGGADAAFGGDDAADGHAVAEMSVGHEGEVVRGAGADPRLLQSVLFVRTPDGDVVDLCIIAMVPFWP